jgi:hypothetical protein
VGSEMCIRDRTQTVETAIAESGMGEATLARALDLSQK